MSKATKTQAAIITETQETQETHTKTYRLYKNGKQNKQNKQKEPVTIETAIVKYEALVRHLARKYEGNGAEYEDLVQTGYIGIIKYLPGHENDEYLSWYLNHRLPRHVSYAAAQMRKNARRKETEALDDIQEPAAPPAAGSWYDREKQMFSKAAALLTPEETEEIMLLYAGKSKRQTAKQFGISHPALIKRIEKIRKNSSR